MRSTVIFDMDGLLIDSEPFFDITDKTLLKEYGVEYHGELWEQIKGGGMRRSVRTYLDYYKIKESPEVFLNKRLKIFESHIDKVAPMPGAVSLVKNLAENGFKIGLATGGHRVETAKKNLANMGIVHYFSSIVSGFDVQMDKPQPDIYFFAAAQLEADPKKCIIFEDAINGVIAGYAAGAKVIGVNKNKKVHDKLKAAGAVLIYDSLDEVALDHLLKLV